MRTSRGKSRALALGAVGLLLAGPFSTAVEAARGRIPIDPSQIPTQAELDEVTRPSRLIFENGYKMRRLGLESVIKQAMDSNYAPNTVKELAKLFAGHHYGAIAIDLGMGGRPTIFNADAGRGPAPLGTGKPPPPILPDADHGKGQGGDLTGRMPTPGITGGAKTDAEFEALARDLENGIHNEILKVTQQKGHNLVALNVFAQTLDMVKVVLIVATKDLPDEKIRPTLRAIRSIIENEVLAAKYPGVKLAELSSFTILNEKDSHFFEHPVLYWQMKEQGWTAGPATPGRIRGEGPEAGNVSGNVQDYFTSGEFVPEEDFDERDLLGGSPDGL